MSKYAPKIYDKEVIKNYVFSIGHSKKMTILYKFATLPDN